MSKWEQNAVFEYSEYICLVKRINGIVAQKTLVTELVRCKECKYFIDNLTEDDTDEVYGECCFDWDIKMPKADDFCSYGEREGE